VCDMSQSIQDHNSIKFHDMITYTIINNPHQRCNIQLVNSETFKSSRLRNERSLTEFIPALS